MYNNFIKQIKKIFINIFGGKVDFDIDEKDDNIINVVNSNINSHPLSSIIPPTTSSYIHLSLSASTSTYSPVYSNPPYDSSIEDMLNYREYRKNELKEEFLNDPELLNEIIVDLRKEKIKKLKK